MARLERVVKAARAAAEPHGITLAYHNHSHEFEPLPDGVRHIDHIAGFCKLEPDTYWVYNSRVDPYQYLKDHAQDVALVHLKDGDENGNPCAIGEGKNDILGILRASAEIGVEWVVVENDDPTPDGLSDVQRSIEWIHHNYKGWAGPYDPAKNAQCAFLALCIFIVKKKRPAPCGSK